MACASNDKDNVVPDKFGKELTLKIGESVTIKPSELVVTFSEVVEDSRCPTGVDCFWEGQAIVQLMVNESDMAVVIMRAGKENLTKDTLNGLVYTLLAVNPYPNGVLPIPTEEYKIELTVKEL